jgi:serine/threonine protein kinase
MVTATKAGRYEILGELGRGGMGVVYRARDPLIGRIVAVKTIRLSEEGTGMSHAQLVERFQTEARAAGLLTHPNIVVIYDAGETDGLYYITMELVNGKSLRALLDSGEKFTLPRLLGIMEQVCSALQLAHDNKVVHRDIKPANIMLAAHDLVKITDFGTAKIVQYGVAQQTSAMGTPSYMSPEQIKGKAVDGRSDIFSLGVMLYELTTGQRPFRGQDVASILYRILNEDPEPPQKLNPSLPLGVSSTIMKALTKSPYLRYESCRELLDDLKNYRPNEISIGAKDTPPDNRLASQPPVREAPVREVKKQFNADMPQIPGVELRPTPPRPPRTKQIPPSRETAGNNPTPETEPPIEGVYAGPALKPDLVAVAKRLAPIAVGIVLLILLASFAIKSLSGGHPADDLDPLHPRQGDSPSMQTQTTETGTETGSAEPTPYVSESNPDVATVSELAQPWSSKRFSFRSLTISNYVPALIIRLPGPASESSSYWAFSLEAPFSQCRFVYLDDLEKLASDYGFQAAHPMVVNPCSRAIFDPLQLKELPGNILVRGAIVHGYDPRPPYGIEVKVAGNQVRAIAME